MTDPDTPDTPATGTASAPDIAWAGGAVAAVVVATIALFASIDNAWVRLPGPAQPVEGLAIFAVFIVGAAAVERLLEPLTALAPIDHKGNRGVALWAVATIIGMAASTGLDLHLLTQVGVASPPRILDILVTGLVIGAGTKPLHDLTKLIEKKKEAATAAAP